MDGYEDMIDYLNKVPYESLKEAYWRRKAEKDEPERLRREEAARQRRAAALIYLNNAFGAWLSVNVSSRTGIPHLDDHQASRLVDLVVEYLEMT